MFLYLKLTYYSVMYVAKINNSSQIFLARQWKHQTVDEYMTSIVISIL